MNRLKTIIKKLQAGIAVDNIEEAVASGDAVAEEAAAQAALVADRKRRATEDQVAFGDDMPPDAADENNA